MRVLEPLFGSDAGILHERDYQALLLANTIPPLGTGLLSPILDSLTGPFGASSAEIGLLISVFSAPPIVVIPVVGVLADRYGRKPILLVSILLFGGAGAAITFTTDFGVVLALRALQGVGFGGIGPVIITSIGDLYETTEEATAQGIRFASGGFTLALFPLVSGVIVVAGWRYPFFLYTLALPVAIAVLLWFDEPTRQTGEGGVAATDGGDTRSHVRALAGLVGQPRVFAVVVARGLPGAIWLGFNTYNSIVVVRFMNGTPAQAGLLIAVGSVALGVAGSQAGRLTAYFDSRFYVLLVGNVCLGVGFAVFLFAPVLTVATAGIAVAGVGLGITSSLYRSVITGLASESLRGGLVSVAESFGRVVATVTPVAMGVLIAVTEPRLGSQAAVQTAGLAVALLSSGGGVVCLYAARAAPPVRYHETA